MNLRLQFPPTPENAGKHAQLAAAAAWNVDHVKLDYSPQSLAEVDRIVGGFHSEGLSPEQVGSTVFSFGCYVGEVFVRHADAHWRSAAETPMAELSGFPLVIELGKSSHCNPIGKVFKRLENGEADSLPYFFQMFTTPS